MIAIFLAPLYILFCLYILRWGIRYMGACHHLFQSSLMRVMICLLYGFVALSLLTSFLMPLSELQRLIKRISNYWLGTVLYILPIIAIADVFRTVLKRINFPGKEILFSQGGFVVVGTILILIVAGVSVAGIYGARNIRTTTYNVKVEKKAGNLRTLRVALVADLHLGYSIGTWHMEQMVERVNTLEPDLIVIAGDIFDNEYEALENPEELIKILSGMKSRYGVYACYGNHDIEEKILAGFTFSGKNEKMSDPRMDEFLEKAGIRLLADEEVLIDDSFYLYGRPDYERPGRGIAVRKSPEEITDGMDKNLPILMIDHEPRELQELADAGVDVDLCGHTHDGQMFPGNFTIHFFWENPCGYLQKGNMHNIVTSGIGVFGPYMRVGTKSEICDISINFN